MPSDTQYSVRFMEGSVVLLRWFGGKGRSKSNVLGYWSLRGVIDQCTFPTAFLWPGLVAYNEEVWLYSKIHGFLFSCSKKMIGCSFMNPFGTSSWAKAHFNIQRVWEGCSDETNESKISLIVSLSRSLFTSAWPCPPPKEHFHNACTPSLRISRKIYPSEKNGIEEEKQWIFEEWMIRLKPKHSSENEQWKSITKQIRHLETTRKSRCQQEHMIHIRYLARSIHYLNLLSIPFKHVTTHGCKL